MKNIWRSFTRLHACLKMERGCVEDQPLGGVRSPTGRKLDTCCGWSRTTQTRSAFLKQAALGLPVIFLALLPTTSLAAADGFTIFMIGDSTMADKPVIPENPERGWGQLLPLYFKSHVRIENHAVNGRSSKSFRDEGRWEAVLTKLQPGDWVIIQFGHNDEKPDAARHTQPFGSYTDNLRQYVAETRAKGAHPILATPLVRRHFSAQGVLTPTHGDYPAAVRKLSEDDTVPLLEMNERSRELITQLGDAPSRELFLWTLPGQYQRFPDGNKDNTHFNALGATRMCDLAVIDIHEKIPLLATHLNGRP